MDVLKPRLMCFCFFTSKRPSGYTHSDTPLKKRMFLIEKRLEGKRVASGAAALSADERRAALCAPGPASAAPGPAGAVSRVAKLAEARGTSELESVVFQST